MKTSIQTIKEKTTLYSDTHIEIKDGKGNLLSPPFSNTFVKIGLLDLVECFAESKHINYMMLSEDENRESDTSELSGAKIEITSTYSYKDESTGVMVIVFEIVTSRENYAEVGTLNSIGLMIEDKLVTVATSGGIDISGTDNISITYQVLIDLA